MSALTDYFTSLANKIRSVLGGSATYTPAQMVSAIDDIYAAGSSTSMVGDAVEGDVKAGKTFTNANGSGLTGTFESQTKTETAGTTAKTVTPDNGKYLSSVTINPTPSETKTATPSSTSQDITPSSGKLLSKVTVSAISTQTKTETAGTSAKTVTPDSGKFLSSVTINPTPSESKTATPSTTQQTISPSTGKLLSSVTVEAVNTQTKTVTSSRSSQTVTPDTGYLLSSVTVNGLAPTGTFTATTKSSSIDMGATSNYRYVDTTGVPNYNDLTYTAPSVSSQLDMGENNTYRYVDTSALGGAGMSGSVVAIYSSFNATFSGEYANPSYYNEALFTRSGTKLTYKITTNKRLSLWWYVGEGTPQLSLFSATDSQYAQMSMPASGTNPYGSLFNNSDIVKDRSIRLDARSTWKYLVVVMVE